MRDNENFEELGEIDINKLNSAFNPSNLVEIEIDYGFKSRNSAIDNKKVSNDK